MMLSVVTSTYKSAAYLREFHDRMVKSVEASGFTHCEFVYVNDGSPDESHSILCSLATVDPRVIVINLARNFGHHKALMTGLAHCSGELVYCIDCDLEEQPEWLYDFLKHMQTSDIDVVFGQQEIRKGNWFERLTGQWFWSSINALSGINMPRNITTARLMNRQYVNNLLKFKESELFLAGLWYLNGHRQEAYSVSKLSTSPSTYTLKRKITLLVNAVTSLSSSPLVGIFYLGVVVSIVSLAFLALTLVRYVLVKDVQPGWTSVMLSIWLVGGLVLSALGVVAIYLSKIFVEVKQRPYTLIRDTYRSGDNL